MACAHFGKGQERRQNVPSKLSVSTLCLVSSFGPVFSQPLEQVTPATGNVSNLLVFLYTENEHDFSFPEEPLDLRSIEVPLGGSSVC